MQFDLLLPFFFFLSIYPTKADHCARFAERSDGDISYDPDEEIGLQLGSVATLQCHNGNIRRSRCTASGWKPPTFNRCQQVMRDESNGLNTFGSQSSARTCPPITNISNGFVVYAPLGLPPFRPDSTASLVCNLGFLPSGSTSARCDQTGAWSELGTCESSTIQKCLAIGEISNGKVSYTSGSSGPFGINSVAELSCKLGYSAVGNNRVTCSQNGWEPSPGIGSCIEGVDTPFAQCTAITVLNGQVSYLQTRLESCCASGSTALLTCNPSYSPIGSTSSYCSGTTWTPTIGTCQQVGSNLGLGGVPTVGGTGIAGVGGIPGATCAVLPAPINGQYLYSMGGTLGPFPQGTTATLTCNPGYSINTGIPTTSCQNGVWNPTTIGQCVSTSLNPNGLGASSFGTNALGSSCPAALVANGQMQYSSGPGLGTYPEGASVTVICNAGYQINGVGTATCRSAQWYPPLGICINQGNQNLIGGIGGISTSVCSIGMTAPVGGGTVQYSTGTGVGPWPQGASANLICPVGSVSTSPVATCQYGQWSPTVFQPCSGSGSALGGIGGLTSGTQCIVPLAVVGGTITYSTGQALAPFASGTVGTLRCNTGVASGPTTSSCLNGQWSPTNLGPCGTTGLPSFVGGTGGQQCTFGILNPANGQVTYSQNSPLGPFPSGTSATLTCNSNFMASGTLTSYCQNGQWSPATLGSCSPSNSNGLNSITSFGATNCLPLTVVNGQVTYNQLPSLSSSYPVGTVASLTCNFGFSPINGPTTASCLSNGWSSQQLATCNGAIGRR